MKIQNTFCAFLLFALPLSIFGQTFSLGGNAYVLGYRDKTRSEYIASETKNNFAFLTPTYSTFLSEKLMVGGGIIAGGFDNQYQTVGFQTLKAKSFSGGIAPFVRYYFLKKSKWQFFGAFSFEYSASKSQSVSTYLSGKDEQNTTASARHFTPNIGANYFFHDDIALEIKLLHSQTYFQANNVRSDFNQSSLGWAFQNFLKLKENKKSKKQPKEAPPQYLHSQKWLVGGSVSIGRFSQGTHLSKDLTLNFNPEMGYFLTKNIVLGTNLYLNAAKNNPFNWNIAPFVRFYQPLSPDLSLFAEGKLSLYNVSSFDAQNVEKKYIQDQYNLSLGYNYFLSQHVALEGMFYNFSYQKEKTPYINYVKTSKSHEFGLQAKVRYFLN